MTAPRQIDFFRGIFAFIRTFEYIYLTTAKKGKTSNSFEFTSFWAAANNRVIPDLIDFTRTFFAKHTILNIITKYCIFTSENMLMVMRPYQITATERILNRIEIANNYKKYGDVAGGGYIWHTTGQVRPLHHSRLQDKLHCFLILIRCSL